MTLLWKSFCEAVCWHIICRKPVYSNASSLNLLPQPVLVDIDVVKLRGKLLVLLDQESNHLQVITVDCELMTWTESNVFEESTPPNRLFCSVGKS